MKKILLIIVMVISVVYSQTYDTLKKQVITEGIRYYKLRSNNNNVTLHLMKVELKNPKIKISTAKAYDMVHQFNYVPQGGWKGPIPEEPLTILSMRKSVPDANKFVYAALSGDFGNAGRPNNIQIIDGVILQNPKTNSVITFNDNKDVKIERIQLTAKLKAKINDTVVNIDGINEGFRQADKMIMYNRYIGSDIEEDSIHSGQNQWGWESALGPLLTWKLNDTMPCLVIKERQVGDTRKFKVTKDEIILSEHNTYDKWTLKYKMKVGDVVKLYTHINSSVANPTHMIGGSPQIVKNGVVQVEQGYADEGITFDPSKPKPYLTKSARTAIGYNLDNSILYMVTVDSNSTSVGMNLQELGDFLISVGCYDALNLCGGERSAMAAILDPTKGIEMVNEQPKGEPNIINAFLVYYDENATGVIDLGNNHDKSFSLEQNYPNPFNPTTIIRFNLAEECFVTLKIFDILGKEVKTLVNDYLSSGTKQIRFDAQNISAGVYYYQLQVMLKNGQSFQKTKKMILVK